MEYIGVPVTSVKIACSLPPAIVPARFTRKDLPVSPVFQKLLLMSCAGEHTSLGLGLGPDRAFGLSALCRCGGFGTEIQISSGILRRLIPGAL